MNTSISFASEFATLAKLIDIVLCIVLNETILTRAWALFRWHAYIGQRWVIVGPLALGKHVRWPSARPMLGNDWSVGVGYTTLPTVSQCPPDKFPFNCRC